MNQERLMKIILGPLTSEKSSLIADLHNQFVFKVVKDATKSEIKKAVELLFNVKVKAVNTLIMKGKQRVFRQKPGRRSDWKKAFVTLHEGHDINFAGVE